MRWYRSNDDQGVVVGYEVTRDGQVLGVWDALSVVDTDLGAGTDGTSWFDDSLLAGTGYTFEVVDT